MRNITAPSGLFLTIVPVPASPGLPDLFSVQRRLH